MLVSLYRVKYVEMTKVVQVDRNNCYKELMASIGGRH